MTTHGAASGVSADEERSLAPTSTSPSLAGLSHEANARGSAMSKEHAIRHLRTAIEVAKEGVKEGHHPFGAVLVAPDNMTVLLSQFNLDTVNHAEAVLAREAAKRYDSEYLWHCTLVTTVEPCAMCAGTQYWANIGRVVFGMTESELLEFTGTNHPQNPTLSLPCAELFRHGQKPIQVMGPFPELNEEISAPHVLFWK